MNAKAQQSQAAGNGQGRRPVTIDDVMYRRSRQSGDLRRLPALIVRAVRLIWEAAPGQLLLSAALQLIAGLSLAAQLLVARRILDVLVADEATLTIGALVPEFAIFAVLLLLVWLSAVARAEQQSLLGELVEKRTTSTLMSAATSVPLLKYDEPEFYDRLQRARINAAARPLEIVNGLLGILQGGFTVMAVGAMLLWIEPLVFLLATVGYIPTWYTNRLSARVLYRHRVAHTAGDRRRQYLYTILTRKEEAHEVRAFSNSDYLTAEYNAVFGEKIRDLKRVIRKRLILGFIGGAVSVAVTALALGLLVAFVTTGRLDLPDAATAVAALVLISGRLRGLTGSAAALYEGSLFLEDFTRFLRDYSPSDPVPPNRTAAWTGPVELPGFETIELDRVGFTYPARVEPSLHDVSLKIFSGEVIALVGENGSGKTTLAKLLAGLYTPTRGSLLWDGAPLAEADLWRVREHVAVIFQDFARYFLSARENVGVGQPLRVDEFQAIQAAAAQAGAHEFLASLPNGYETLLGPEFVGGSDLSGGQWQRVALARAYFRDAPLLILDEPTASLDPRGEYEVFERVRRLARGRTVVLISHRFSSARSADRIIVMHQGRIAEEGPHEALMAADGLYAELFALQAKSYGEPIR